MLDGNIYNSLEYRITIPHFIDFKALKWPKGSFQAYKENMYSTYYKQYQHFKNNKSL